MTMIDSASESLRPAEDAVVDDGASQEPPRPNRSLRRIAIAGAAILAVLVVVLWPRAYGPLDPDSPRPDGALALRRLIDEYAGDVRVTDRLPTTDDDVAVLLVDGLSGEARSRLVTWVADGGLLVVPGPGSIARENFGDDLDRSTDADADADNPLAIIERGRDICTLTALDQISVISVNDVTPLANAASKCFDDGNGPLTATVPLGEGRIIEMADMAAFNNELLDVTDNAGLAVALMAPTVDSTVVFLRSDLTVPPQPSSTQSSSNGDQNLPEPPARERVGTGGSSLAELLPPYFLWIFLQLLFAWLLFVWARARRFGKPVHEQLPVQVPGSALVEATGRLLRRTNPDVTGRVLVESFREDLRVALMQPADISDVDLVKVAADRGGINPARLFAALNGPAVENDTQLVSLNSQLESLRQEVLRDRSPYS